MSEAAAASASPRRASFADWMAVIAGMIGSLMALMDVSIVNSALPVIQGEIGATPSEGTWVVTSYLVAEIVIIPLTAWLERMLGQRALLLGGAGLFTLFSVFCGFADTLPELVAGRIGQGLSGGVLIPTALNLLATRLPPGQQTLGLALTGMAALLGPVIGPVLGGWLTEHYSWQYAFFINVPICAVQAGMLMIGIKGTRHNWGELRNADWPGIAGMTIGLGSVTTLLEEGHREQWFDSPLIWRLGVASMIGFALVTAGQLRKSVRPVIRLSLLTNSALSSSVALLAGLGMLLFTSMFITPQFLVSIAGYSAFQAGQLLVVIGVISIPVALLYTLLVKLIDMRAIVAFAMLGAAAANFLISDLTVASTGSAFVAAQLLFGAGITLTAIPLQSAVISSVPPEDAPEANALSAISRNLGGSLGLAGLASFQAQRMDVHYWQIHASLSANDPVLQDSLAQAGSMFGAGSEAALAGMRMLDGEIVRQALTMSFNDIYLAFAVIGVTLVPLVLLLRPPPKGAGLGAMH